MPSNSTQITPPRVSIIDERTGAVSREWYRWFYNLYTITGEGLGVTPVINGGTGLSTIPTNGQLLIGNGSGYTLNTLTASTGITVTNAAGTITISSLGLLSLSVVSANGFAGTVSTVNLASAITLTTTITGVLKGNGTAILAAVPNTDYIAPSAVVTKTADFSLAATENWVINNKSGSTCTVTLPAASSWSGRSVVFKNMQPQTLVSASSNVVPIDGTTAGTAILLNVVGNWATLVSDGTNWIIMQAAGNNNLLLE